MTLCDSTVCFAHTISFAEISEENIQNLLNSKDSKATKRSVAAAVKRFWDFLTSKDVSSKTCLPYTCSMFIEDLVTGR